MSNIVPFPGNDSLLLAEGVGGAKTDAVAFGEVGSEAADLAALLFSPNRPSSDGFVSQEEFDALIGQLQENTMGLLNYLRTAALYVQAEMVREEDGAAEVMYSA